MKVCKVFWQCILLEYNLLTTVSLHVLLSMHVLLLLQHSRGLFVEFGIVCVYLIFMHRFTERVDNFRSGQRAPVVCDYAYMQK